MSNMLRVECCVLKYVIVVKSMSLHIFVNISSLGAANVI